jgi:hypothetical protein
MSEMALYEPFKHLQPKLWAKERPGVKLAVWLPTIKSQESTQIWCQHVERNMVLGTLKENYKIALDLIPIRGLSKKLWMPKVPGVQIKTILGLHFGSPGKKWHLDVSAVD